jgi:hypothetical protein
MHDLARDRRRPASIIVRAEFLLTLARTRITLQPIFVGWSKLE